MLFVFVGPISVCCEMRCVIEIIELLVFVGPVSVHCEVRSVSLKSFTLCLLGLFQCVVR